jgi:hypothetical protein
MQHVFNALVLLMDDSKFVAAIKATGKNNIIMGGLTTRR